MHTEISASAFETALNACQPEGEGRSAINWAELAKNLAKISPGIIAIMRLTGVPIPSGADAIARLIIDRLFPDGVTLTGPVFGADAVTDA